MDQKNKGSTSNGYRWRDELVNRLIPYVKEGVDRKTLNNRVRRYVPTFFPTSFPASDNGSAWLCALPVRPNQHWWGKEIEDVGKEFAKESGHLNDNLAREILKNHNWEVNNTHVDGISGLDKRGRWRYDALKREVAVEVELTNRTQIFKDAFKFLIGQAMGQIDIGIIMIRKWPEKEGQPYFGWIDPSSHPIFTTLPMLKVAFYGFPNLTDEKIS